MCPTVIPVCAEAGSDQMSYSYSTSLLYSVPHISVLEIHHIFGSLPSDCRHVSSHLCKYDSASSYRLVLPFQQKPATNS